MTSINTNVAAMAALQTLRSINSEMAKTQGMISSGLRVETAADNAAYWSISTTMRSDREAISAVGDSLGLAAAKVDVTYAGLDATVDILSEFRAKLVAAREPGVDRSKIQKELDQFKQQFLSVASSASFNSVNWLQTEFPQNLWELPQIDDELVSSFIRSADGSIKIGTTQVNVSAISLFNAGGGGVLQADPRGLGTIGGFRTSALSDTGFTSYQMWRQTMPVTLAAGETITMDVALDNGTTTATLTIDKALIDATLGTSTGTIPNSGDAYLAVIQQAAVNAGIGGQITIHPQGDGVSMSFESMGTPGEDEAEVLITNVVRTPAGAIGLDFPTYTSRLHAASTAFPFTPPVQLHRDVEFSFDISINGTDHSIVVDRDLVNSSLGVTDGRINGAAEFAQILDSLLAPLGVNVTDSGSTVAFDIDTTMFPVWGYGSSIVISNITDNIGPVADFDIVDVDITDPANDLDNYLLGLDAMLKRAIDAGATLGAIKTRVEMQTEFAQTLMDTMDKGIGRLVDADMNEASTRLKALQTQQQLAIQSLNIANANAENILKLFD